MVLGRPFHSAQNGSLLKNSHGEKKMQKMKIMPTTATNVSSHSSAVGVVECCEAATKTVSFELMAAAVGSYTVLHDNISDISLKVDVCAALGVSGKVLVVEWVRVHIFYVPSSFFRRRRRQRFLLESPPTQWSSSWPSGSGAWSGYPKTPIGAKRASWRSKRTSRRVVRSKRVSTIIFDGASAASSFSSSHAGLNGANGHGYGSRRKATP